MHVVITGGNRGIGKALAEGYRAAGHEVTATSRDGTTGARLDVTDPGAVGEFAEALDSKPVDLLICNAGVYLDKGAAAGRRIPGRDVGGGLCRQCDRRLPDHPGVLPDIRAAKGGSPSSRARWPATNGRRAGLTSIARQKAAVLNLGWLTMTLRLTAWPWASITRLGAHRYEAVAAPRSVWTRPRVG
ncbi:MAG: hypothetical protein R3D85_15425 [Paracoccaceae bacterium]